MIKLLFQMETSWTDCLQWFHDVIHWTKTCLHKINHFEFLANYVFFSLFLRFVKFRLSTKKLRFWGKKLDQLACSITREVSLSFTALQKWLTVAAKCRKLMQHEFFPSFEILNRCETQWSVSSEVEALQIFTVIYEALLWSRM